MKLRERIRNAKCLNCGEYKVPRWLMTGICVLTFILLLGLTTSVWQQGYDSGHHDGYWDGYNKYNPYYHSADFYLYSCKHHLNENYTSFYILSTSKINGGPWDMITVDQNFDGVTDGYCNYTATIPYRVIFP